MNASTVILMVVIGLFAVVSGIPVADSFKQDGLYIRVKEEVEDSEPLLAEQLDDQEESGLRFRRATCDLLSISLPIGSLNHSACAAHCLAMRKGFRGGRCKDGVCHCRR